MSTWERMIALGRLNAIDAEWRRWTDDPALYEALGRVIEARSRLMRAMAAFV